MCDKCVELDKKIEHYRWIASMIGDQLTLDRIKRKRRLNPTFIAVR
jgi:hypothetical protein